MVRDLMKWKILNSENFYCINKTVSITSYILFLLFS
jgi:hypothetical protein